MNSKVADRINEIRKDRMHGAGWLSRQAIVILNLAIEESQADTIANFTDEVKAVATELMKARPNMISIANYIHQFTYQIILASRNEKELDSLKTLTQIKGNELIKLSEEASSKSIEHGCRIISNADIIITCSYSSTVCSVFELSRQKGTTFRVIAAESRSEGKAYGEITAEQLKLHQIPVEILLDEAIDKHTAKADKALVGADSILVDSSLINGTPSLRLAQAARKENIPFYTVCETAKLDVQGYIDLEAEPEPGFDKIPPDLISGIITENGIMKPDQVIAYINKEATRTEMEVQGLTGG